MHRPHTYLALIILLHSANLLAAEPNRAEAIQLTLPKEFYVVEGLETSVYFENLVVTQSPDSLQFEVECPVGKSEGRRWSVVPKPDEVGVHEWRITVRDADGERLGAAAMRLHVITADAGSEGDIRLLIIGDSLTHATEYPNEIARLLSRPGNPTWKMLGTHRPASAIPGVAHEGYGGWTWKRFVSHYESEPAGTPGKGRSPFVFAAADGKPGLDVARYFREHCDGQLPDFIIIKLGINDCFGADPENPDPSIDAMFEQADILLKALREAAPRAEIGLCLTTPPNSRQSSFEATYGDRYTQWGWKRIQHRLVQRQMEHFSKYEDPQIRLIPTQLSLDVTDGYPANDSVHPNAAGYQQIGRDIYGWLKSRLAAR